MYVVPSFLFIFLSTKPLPVALFIVMPFFPHPFIPLHLVPSFSPFFLSIKSWDHSNPALPHHTSLCASFLLNILSPPIRPVTLVFSLPSQSILTPSSPPPNLLHLPCQLPRCSLTVLTFLSSLTTPSLSLFSLTPLFFPVLTNPYSASSFPDSLCIPSSFRFFLPFILLYLVPSLPFPLCLSSQHSHQLTILRVRR